jgi:hypothetical protein
MSPTTLYPAVVVPAVPPQPPFRNLIKAALKPGEESDPTSSRPDALAELPADLVAELNERAGPMWVRGITYAPESHSEATVRDPCDQTTVIPRATNLPVVVAIPYLVLVEDSCSAFGFESRDFKGRATRLLENAKYKAVEKEFWTGALAKAAGWPNAYLAAETAIDVTPGAGAASLERGLAALQEALQECGFGGRGMIHMEAKTLTNYLTIHDNNPHLTSDDDDVLHDMLGNIVVPGTGYTGTSPKGEAPVAGSAWIYATDLVSVREDEVQIFPESFSEAMDWGQKPPAGRASEPNTIRFQAQKFAIAYWDQACHFACRVKLE